MFKKILIIFLLIILLLALVLAVFLVRERAKFPGEAAIPGVLSLENSYLFASPLVAKIGGEKISVFAFVLSDQGLGIPGKKVVLYSAPSLTASVVRDETDSRGLAVFEVTSFSSGQFRVWASLPGEGQIQQTVLVTFE